MGDHGNTDYALVLHTTETAGMPGFNDGKTGPHQTYSLATRKWVTWAEFEDGRVGTLKGHATNHANDKAYQVEIIGYSDPNHRPWIGDATDDNYRDLAAFYKWARDRYGIGLDVTPTPKGGWLYGASSPFRMTTSETMRFSGITAHGAIAGNSHWDTGVLDLQRIHDLSLQEEPDMPTTFTIGETYQLYEEVTWLLYELAGGIIDVNANSSQVEPVLGKTDVRLVTEQDFTLIGDLLGMNDKERNRLIDDGLYPFGKEIAALRSLTYD